MAQQKRTLAAAAQKTVSRAPLAHGVGRRKSSVARVFLRHGSGAIVVNNKNYNEYFDTQVARLSASAPFRINPMSSSFDASVNVTGGGKSAQADAVKLAIARAMVIFDETLRPTFRKDRLLTVDSRNKERKKPGQAAARKKFQFVKR
ncbi:MAG TPA: 30S ribosomal protein S9 [Candidatus Babeliales bacterium]|jgi:small subunit ribosomal protein S9|nr:30S ribosomal protein S9 [Candidatus Babeliales bacterium]